MSVVLRRFLVVMAPAAWLCQAQGGPVFDLVCEKGEHVKTWNGVKKRFRNLLTGTNVLGGIKRETLSETLDAAMKELKEAKALGPEFESECPVGKLNLQLLSVNAIVDPTALAQLLTGTERLASPILTLLLDVPWIAIVESGWPIFGFLAELNARRRETKAGINTELADGVAEGAARAFLVEVTQALATGNIGELKQLSALYLSFEDQQGAALATLTALAAQAAVESTVGGRIKLLEAVQNVFKMAIASAPELDLALGTQWPLWDLIHMAVDGMLPA